MEDRRKTVFSIGEGCMMWDSEIASIQNASQFYLGMTKTCDDKKRCSGEGLQTGVIGLLRWIFSDHGYWAMLV